MRFKNFNSIYWMLAPIKILSRNEELAFDDCKRILDYLKSSLEQQVAILIIVDPVITVVIDITNLVIEIITLVIKIIMVMKLGGGRQSNREGLGSWEEARVLDRRNSTTSRETSYGEEKCFGHFDSIRFGFLSCIVWKFARIF